MKRALFKYGTELWRKWGRKSTTCVNGGLGFGTNYAISGMSGQTFPHEAELAAMSYRSYHPEGS
jgi:hypothetical protein